MKQSAIIKVAGATALTLLTSAVPAPLLWALSVTPARTELHLAPGQEMTAIITATNPDNVPYDVELSEKPWFIYPNNRQIQVPDWLHLPSRTRFRLKAGKSKDVKIRVICPKDAVGELMGMVSFTYTGDQPSMITPMISTAVYLDVKGTEKNEGEIVALGAGTRNGHFQVGAQIKATGNVRLRPSGAIRLLDEKGAEVVVYRVAEANPIFPGTVRDYAASGPDAPPKAGTYTLSAEIHSGMLTMKNDHAIHVKPDGDVE